MDYVWVNENMAHSGFSGTTLIGGFCLCQSRLHSLSASKSKKVLCSEVTTYYFLLVPIIEWTKHHQAFFRYYLQTLTIAYMYACNLYPGMPVRNHELGPKSVYNYLLYMHKSLEYG